MQIPIVDHSPKSIGTERGWISLQSINSESVRIGETEVQYHCAFHDQYSIITMFVTSAKFVAATSAQFSRLFSKSMCGKAAALAIFDAGLKRADPYTAVFNYLKTSKDSIDGVPVG